MWKAATWATCTAQELLSQAPSFLQFLAAMLLHARPFTPGCQVMGSISCFSASHTTRGDDAQKDSAIQITAANLCTCSYLIKSPSIPDVWINICKHLCGNLWYVANNTPNPKNVGEVQPLSLLKQSQHISRKNGLPCVLPGCDPVFKHAQIDV